MRRAVFFLLVLLIVPSSLFAQYRDRDSRRYRRDDMFELTPFGGYRYGGTIFGDQSALSRFDLDVESAASYGVDLGIPLGSSGMKLELMLNRQATHLKAGGGLFETDQRLANFDVTYYHGGVLIPFARSRNATPFVVVTAGVANLDPDLLGVSAENRFSASAGVGVKVPLNSNIALRLEARGYFTSLGNEEDDCFRCYYDYGRDLYQGETNLGLSIRF
ncbi:MAG TPA: outer membrane beta-barrel protein [Thermoanaerobaculia bacterium]|nr:outer membrane beta-barrel protein [Thermoanaerobaculia bacterium]